MKRRAEPRPGYWPLDLSATLRESVDRKRSPFPTRLARAQAALARAKSDEARARWRAEMQQRYATDYRRQRNVYAVAWAVSMACNLIIGWLVIA